MAHAPSAASAERPPYPTWPLTPGFLRALVGERRPTIRQLLLDSYVERGYKLLDSESGAEESLLWLFRAYEQGSKSAVLPYLLRRAMQPVDARRAAISRGENLTAAAIGPDDHGVVLVAEAGSAWLADADSGQPLRTLGPARSATFCADGQRILLCGDTGVQISEAATGRVLVEIGGSFRRAGFSSDGRSVFAVDTEDTFRHFDADTGRALASIASDERMGLILAIDPTGRLLAVTAGPEYEVELRERESGARSVALVQPPQQVLAATFSADGQRLFVVTKSEVGVVLDVRSGRSLARFDDVVSTELSPATFCPEGRRIVLPGRTGCVTRICDALSGAVLERLRGHLHLDALTVNGRTLGENIAGAEVFHDDVIRPLDKPIYAEGALAVLRGNLAPDGVVIKPSACAPHLLQHSGRALVFDDYPSLKKAVDDPDLDVTGNDVLVLRNAGPLGAGMPEWGMLPIPTKLLKAGVKDMLRLSDARMSGTSYGGCLLHCAPEAALGGPLALVKTGDRITVDVPARRIHLEVSDEELAARRAAWSAPPPRYERGYGWIFGRHVLQADQGCDFDFLETSFGAAVPEPDIF